LVKESIQVPTLKFPVLKDKEKIKVTVITGFLGAGKTTFINNLLRKYPERRFALIENEFGDVSIDINLIKGLDVSRMFELKNGCICCSISNEYELVLEELYEKYTDIEHLLIETTGLADPVNVILPILQNPELINLYFYNGCICLTDPVSFVDHDITDLKMKQIAVSDLIILNKTDLITHEKIAEICRNLSEINPTCIISHSKFGDPETLRLDNICTNDRFYPDSEFPIKVNHGIETGTLILNELCDRQKFIEKLTYNLDIHKEKIYRFKGVLYFKDDPYEYLIHGLGSGFELSEMSIAIGVKTSKIVFAGKNLSAFIKSVSE
jgi:G3E family GTPase